MLQTSSDHHSSVNAPLAVDLSSSHHIASFLSLEKGKPWMVCSLEKNNHSYGEQFQINESCWNGLFGSVTVQHLANIVELHRHLHCMRIPSCYELLWTNASSNSLTAHTQVTCVMNFLAKNLTIQNSNFGAFLQFRTVIYATCRWIIFMMLMNRSWEPQWSEDAGHLDFWSKDASGPISPFSPLIFFRTYQHIFHICFFNMIHADPI